MGSDYISDSIALTPARPQVPWRQFFCDEVGRREFICGGGASVLSVILATLLAGSKPIRAEALTGLPELDRVAVRIVVDSYQFAVAPSRRLPNLDVQHFGWGLSDKPPRSLRRGKNSCGDRGLSSRCRQCTSSSRSDYRWCRPPSPVRPRKVGRLPSVLAPALKSDPVTA